MFEDLVDYPSNILKNVRKTNKTPPQGVKGVVGEDLNGHNSSFNQHLQPPAWETYM